MTQPLGKNDGGYFGETIRISDVLERTLAAAEQNGWSVELFPGAGELPLYGCLLYTSPSPRDRG